MIHGKNPTLLSVTYIRPDKKSDIEECFEVIYKTEDGTVYKSNEPAEADIYFVKPEYRDFDYNKPQERMERLHKKRVLISQIRFEIAKEMGERGEQIIQDAFESKKFSKLNQLFKWPYAYGCDFQPEYYFMKDWYSKYTLENVKLTKAFIDIETDIIDHAPDLEKLYSTAYSPIICVTVFLEESNESFTFILRPYKPSKLTYSDPEEYVKRYSLYEKQVKDHEWLMENMNKYYDHLHTSFDKTYGYIDYHIREYEHEIDLISDIFRLIHDKKPNFCLAWNMRFDLQYLLERIKTLGYDPKSIMCHHDFENLKCFFRVDKMTYMIEKQFDYFYCSSYTQYVCQMRLYASIRKSQQMLKSVSLNAIGDRELKDKKVEYPDETNMMEFPYIDWHRYITYNIKDVLIQVGIERKTNDLMVYYMRSHSNLTPYSKIFRETHLLRNVREMYFNKDGWVQGNNINILDEDEDEKFKRSEIQEDSIDEDELTFKGAIMADPLMNDNVGMRILGAPSNTVYQNAIDYDMGAFYPSNKIASNMDPGTLLYKASFDNDEFISGEYRNASLNTEYQERDKNGNIRLNDITGEMVNTYASGNILTFGYNYLGLPNITELATVVTRELKK